MTDRALTIIGSQVEVAPMRNESLQLTSLIFYTSHTLQKATQLKSYQSIHSSLLSCNRVEIVHSNTTSIKLLR